MYFLLFLLLLCALLIYLVYKYPLEVSFVFDSGNMETYVTAFWLSPLLKIIAKPENSKAKISVYVFKKRLITKMISKSTEKKRKFKLNKLKAISIHDSRLEIFYGLNEPALTGILCGLISSINSVVRINDLKQYPSFVPYEEYIKISANIKVNIGKTLANLMMLNSNKTKRR